MLHTQYFPQAAPVGTDWFIRSNIRRPQKAVGVVSRTGVRSRVNTSYLSPHRRNKPCRTFGIPPGEQPMRLLRKIQEHCLLELQLGRRPLQSIAIESVQW